ncbi:sensory box histidine kinase [Pseudomonas fluorescens Q2-87]|uniref:histidine kinase n=2 Tax=Pseudomonas fluorescens TaxID=294 RepID=J2MLA0_PSEFQ|nr:ATP-binding protein [Pseudomonas fluorescens]EJL01617.1 sensory box histidine kinase [Pseudomonas fluorescens Q2-87]
MPLPTAMFKSVYESLRYSPSQMGPRPAMGISTNPLVNVLGWAVGLVVACGIFVINSETHSDLAPTLLYVTLLLMAANLFSINLVIAVALISMFLLTAMFAYNGGYHRWESTTGFFRCLTALSAIAFLALRSKQASDNLRHNEAYLIGAQRLSQTGSLGFRGDRQEMSWSQESARIFEYPQSKVPTVSMMLERTHPEDLERVRGIFQQAARRDPQIEAKLRLLMPDGRIKHIHMIASPLLVQHGHFQYLGAVMDITASKEAEEALFQAQTQLAHVTRLTSLGEMAASIAHEVNQPLTAITSSGEACRRWLARPVPDHKEALDNLDRIVANACRASEVISRIRALSRKCDPLRRPEQLDDIVSETLCLVQQQLAHHKVKANVDLATADAQISADRVQLQQVIINLIINACHAMEGVKVRDRALHIRTWLEDNEAMLEVADQGTGIEPEILPSLFNAFFTTREKGLGMGLSICRSIIDFHGGRIWASSEVGQGTSFRFALPLLACADLPRSLP